MGDEQRTESGSQAAGDNRPRPRPPSWFKSESPAEARVAPPTPPPPAAAPPPQAAAPPPPPQAAAPPPPPQAAAPPPPPQAAAPPPQAPPPSDEILLGAPAVPEDDVLGVTAPTPPVPQPPPEIPDFTPPPPVRVQAAPAPSAPEEDLPDERIRAELDQLSQIVYTVESLGYLKPRLARIRKDGCSQGDLMGLYRIVSQALLDHMLKQSEVMSQVRSEYERRLKEEQEMILFQAGKDLMKSLKGGGAPAAPPPPPPPAEPSAQDNAQVAVLRKQMEIKDEMLMEAQERYEKLVRDVQNIRARQEKDLDMQLQRAKEALFRKLLPVLDSFDQAVGTVTSTTDMDAILQGMTGIHRLLLDACTSEGLQPVEAKGEPFDPHMHEAMGHVVTPDIPEDHVYDEVRRGYMLGEKLLRASMVRLARAAEPGAPSAGPKPAEPAPVAAERPLPAFPSEHPGPAPGPGAAPKSEEPKAEVPEPAEPPVARESSVSPVTAEPVAKAAEPKAAEPAAKAAEPKAAEPVAKAAEPKAAEPAAKAAEPKAAEPVAKAAEPKAAEPVAKAAEPAPKLPVEHEQTLVEAGAARPPESALRALEHEQTAVEAGAAAAPEPQPLKADGGGPGATGSDLPAGGGPEPSATAERPSASD